ncbi:hypothetical protein [Lactococcus formosensis]|uniref:hypothetical protein n=1 Tax=Lactococcus formosensis TaxID=1281486 RepID=UPI0022E81238|nr:hypothetical protein [Lactococcus formosensis]
MKETKVELDDLRKGLGIIANVMLLGRLLPTDCEEVTSEQMVVNYKDLCEMTENYTQKLIDDTDEIEVNWRADNVDAQQYRKIQSISKVG